MRILFAKNVTWQTVPSKSDKKDRLYKDCVLIYCARKLVFLGEK